MRYQRLRRWLGLQLKAGSILGDRAAWGSVGYSGQAYVPASGTYAGRTDLTINYTTDQDSGAFPRNPQDLGNLLPLVLAALNHVAFVREGFFVTTSSN